MRLSPALRLLALIIALPLARTQAQPEAAPSFLQALPPTERSAIGTDQLEAGQRAELDRLIERDVRFAREGDVVAFTKTFTERRTVEERQRAGIDRLTPAERTHLDQLVAAAMACRPMVAYVDRGFRPRLPENITETKPLPEVHGQASLFMGGSSHGGSFYGGSFDAVVIDPSRKFMLGVGMSEIRGRGLPPCFDGPVW